MGDQFSGRTKVSKTFGGGSIPSSPATGLDYNEEKLKISLERNKGKPKKIIKEKKWGAHKYDSCAACNTIEFSHSRNGICERCNGAFSGETREKIILSHNSKCDNCNITRDEVVEKYKHDLFITKEQEVFCKMCFLWKTGKKLGDSRKNKWKKFYKQKLLIINL